MPSDLQTLDTIFNSRVFRVPDYQRGYAWGARELSAFWQDLTRLGDTQKHYTGQLTVEPVPRESWCAWDEDRWLIEGKGYQPFYVVDGQQRLTTAIILLKCLIDAVPEGATLAFSDKADHVKKFLFQKRQVACAYLFGYERDNPSHEYLKTEILGQPSNQFEGAETTYTANLRRARDYFRQCLSEMPTHSIEQCFKALTQRFLFNLYEVEGELDVFIVFETMNNRGKPLSRLELLKNRLIYLSTLVPAPSSESDRQALRRNVNDAWKTAYSFLGRSPEHTLDDDDFLRAHWTMYFSYARDEAAQFASFLLDNHFTAVRAISGQLSATDLQKYATSIQESVKSWYAVAFPADAGGVRLSDDIVLRLERLNRVGRGAFGPLVMAALQRQEKNDDLIGLLEAAERFVFVVGRLCQRRSDTGDSEFYRLAGEVYSKRCTLPQATQAIREKTDLYYSLEKLIAEMCDEDEGFYSWSGLRHLLFEYEQDLKRAALMNTDKVSWAALTASRKDHVTVEHVYPRSAKPGDWPSFETLNDAERRGALHSLGNLLPLSVSRNARFSNRSFEEKRKDDENGYVTGSYSEISVAQEETWTPEAVLARGLRILEFIEKRWEISLGTDQEKCRLLGLSFVAGRNQT